MYPIISTLTEAQLAKAQARPLTHAQATALRELFERDPFTGPVSDLGINKASLRSLVQREYVQYLRTGKVRVTPEGRAALKTHS